MKKLYFFPPSPANETNPYSKNYKKALKKYFNVVECDKVVNRGARLDLLKHSFRDSVFVLNWPESINKGIKNFPLFVITLCALFVIQIRGAKLIWMLHNLEPHEGLNAYSKTIMSFLYRYSSLIITHSMAAKTQAEKLTDRPVHYVCHPVKSIEVTDLKDVKKTDIFIWGAILPYKGIAEFVSNPRLQESKLEVRIIGKCKDQNLADRIDNACRNNKNVVFENRRAENEELMAYCRNSRYVLFPYLEGSVSSSGALIDTIVIGGTPIGPNVGAFHDLSIEGLCIVYNNAEELFRLIKSERKIDSENVARFLHENSWDSFADKFNEWIAEL